MNDLTTTTMMGRESASTLLYIRRTLLSDAPPPPAARPLTGEPFSWWSRRVRCWLASVSPLVPCALTTRAPLPIFLLPRRPSRSQISLTCFSLTLPPSSERVSTRRKESRGGRRPGGCGPMSRGEMQRDASRRLREATAISEVGVSGPRRIGPSLSSIPRFASSKKKPKTTTKRHSYARWPLNVRVPESFARMFFIFCYFPL